MRNCGSGGYGDIYGSLIGGKNGLVWVNPCGVGNRFGHFGVSLGVRFWIPVQTRLIFLG